MNVEALLQSQIKFLQFLLLFYKQVLTVLQLLFHQSILLQQLAVKMRK